MSEFKVGDLVECVDDLIGAFIRLKKGEKYKIERICGNYVDIINEQGVCHNGFLGCRFKLVEPNLKVGDKVKCKPSERGVFTVYQIIGQVVFLNIGCSIKPFKLSDIEKVEEKTAPPKFIKVYVWDGPERPRYPVMQYSFGEFTEDGKLKVFSAAFYADSPVCYDNWEVIG